MKKRTGAVALSLAAAVLIWLGGRPEASSRPVFKFTPPAAWERVKTLRGVDGAWLLKKSPTRASVTVMAQKGDETLDTSHIDEQALVSATEQTRAVPYSIMGVTDWKVETHRFKRSPRGDFLEMEGHYTSPSNARVRFVERDYFVGSDAYTVSFSEDIQGSNATSDEKVAQLLDQFEIPGAGH